jgi:hypothetical protein
MKLTPIQQWQDNNNGCVWTGETHDGYVVEPDVLYEPDENGMIVQTGGVL